MPPLQSGSSKAVVGSNISEMIKAGHPMKQAIAAALSKSSSKSKAKSIFKPKSQSQSQSKGKT